MSATARAVMGRSSPCEAAILHAVENAIDSGYSARQFIEEAGELWDYAMRERLSRDAKTFNNAFKESPK